MPLAELRAGDEAAFAALVRLHHQPMVRLATTFVRDRAVAEEVVQETWMAVLTGIGGFEGRSSLKTWMYRILTNLAKTRGIRERRAVPFAALSAVEVGDGHAAGDAVRLVDAQAGRWPSAWSAAPRTWETLPEERLAVRETLRAVAGAIEELPPVQRDVVRLRDVEGWSADEVCSELELSAGNQRVLLHRGRARVRAALAHDPGAELAA